MAERRYRPWHPVVVVEKPTTHLELRKADVAALQAVYAGIANEAQQRMAINAVLHITGVDDLEYLPAEHGGERDTAFKGGMRHAGLQLRKLLTFPLARLTGENDARSGHDRSSGKPADDRNAERARR